MDKRVFWLVVLVASVGFAVPPIFDTPVAIRANGTPINVGLGGNASPFMVDWNGDAKQDLVLGQYDGGKVRFYANIGTHYNPTFGSFAYLQADGSDISVTYG